MNSTRISDLSERFLIYVSEQAFLIPLSSLMDYALHVKAVLLGFFLIYHIEFLKGLNLIFDTKSGIINIIMVYV